MNLQHFLVYWRRWGFGLAVQADVHASTPGEARQRFVEMFPTDQIVGVKLARGWNGNAGAGGRWLA